MLSKLATVSGTDPDVLETDSSLRARMEVLSEWAKIRLSSSDLCTCRFQLGQGREVTFNVTRVDFERV